MQADEGRVAYRYSQFALNDRVALDGLRQRRAPVEVGFGTRIGVPRLP